MCKVFMVQVSSASQRDHQYNVSYWQWTPRIDGIWSCRVGDADLESGQPSVGSAVRSDSELRPFPSSDFGTLNSCVELHRWQSEIVCCFSLARDQRLDLYQRHWKCDGTPM
jgi:hypothetical protein